MTERECRELIKVLRMTSLSAPKKWHILNQAADKIEQLMEENRLLKRSRRAHETDMGTAE